MSGLGSKAPCIDSAPDNVSAPTSRPILFSGPMIRALLASTKTQTRRALKHQPLDIIPMPEAPGRQWVTLEQREPEPKGKVVRCRFGAPGDLLWVRETWQSVFERQDGQRFTEARVGVQYAKSWIEYAATSSEPPPTWRPSIHMPRAASRITLRITDVRVERLQDISEADAIAEGVERILDPRGDGWKSYEVIHEGRHKGEPHPHAAVPNRSPVTSYRELWESINGAESWVSNPWVWALSFERVDA